MQSIDSSTGVADVKASIMHRHNDGLFFFRSNETHNRAELEVT